MVDSAIIAGFALLTFDRAKNLHIGILCAGSRIIVLALQVIYIVVVKCSVDNTFNIEN